MVAPPSLDEQLRQRLPTPKHIPRQARGLAAQEYAKLLKEVADSKLQSVDAWGRLSMFWPCILRQDPSVKRGGRRRRQQGPHSFCVKLLRRWAAGEHDALWQEAVSAAEESRAAPRPRPAAVEANVKRAKVAVGEGRFAAAIRALTSTGHAAESAETVAKLRKLHPVHDLPEPEDGAAPEPFVLEAATVLKSISTFPTGSAGGCMGLRPQHLKPTPRSPITLAGCWSRSPGSSICWWQAKRQLL